MPQRVNDNLKSSNTWVWNNMRVSKWFIWIIQTWTHNTMWPCAQRRSDSSFSCLFCLLFLSTQNAWIQKVKKKPPRKPQALWLLCKQEEAPTQQSASLITQTDTSELFHKSQSSFFSWKVQKQRAFYDDEWYRTALLQTSQRDANDLWPLLKLS